MNFEVMDNLFQVIVLFGGMLAAVISAILYKEKKLVILALSYASFAMGTLFWVLYLFARGTVPQIFYVSEISWMASWLFYLSLQMVRTEKLKIQFELVSALFSLLIAVAIVRHRVFSASVLICMAFAVILGSLLYLTIFRMRRQKKASATDPLLICCIVLQISVYVVSYFMTDFSKFNLYFAMDLLLTLSFLLLLPLQIKEVKGS